MNSSRDEWTRLRERAAEFGVDLSPRHLALINIYINELWHWNQRVNLTGLSSREKIVAELLLDSLVPAPYLPQSGKTLDVGSGAGFPGIPLKIVMAEWDMCLLEAHRKKASFLAHVVRLMKLNGVKAVKGRIESAESGLLRKGYDIITARAVARLPQTVAWCAPFLRPGGLLVSFLGAGSQRAIAEAEAAMRKHRLTLDQEIPYTLPGAKKERHTLLLKREGSGCE